MKWKRGSVDSNIDNILNKIEPYYDFIDCKLLLDMSKKFLPEVTFTDDGVTYKLVDELRNHLEESERLRTSNTVSAFKNFLVKKYYSIDRNVDNLPYIHMELQTCWNDINIEGLYELIKKLLPREYRQSVVKHIRITSKCVAIKLHILDFTADSLIEYTGGTLQFMRLIANANPHLKKSNGSNAVMIASYDGNYEVVELLISKGVDYKYQREDGVTAFELACQNVELLLKEQVISDLNISNKDNVTALMIACSQETEHLEIVEILVQAGANVNIQVESLSIPFLNGSTALLMASSRGHKQTVQLLLKCSC
ncbi:PREDICTED: E3 ubiquitin-protein ligase MIB1-like [Amphimedon queenslandica]|uniref:DUF3447 domain-containing protein n=1 Tax=Amphimedon queenslandica TaxID=400682 RepID=A0AAN0JSR4_AMPQE|nr:PREDICTED: E3 ubiquitin-protein ligase MIB1-like [Amphimedon queenslandica]|eukprot:XP_019859900.1 PREDICTED: E3 ubiquitin-protein ligase MIB1-like [Amphimedon queenslandica]